MDCKWIPNPGGNKKYKCELCGFEWNDNTTRRRCRKFDQKKERNKPYTTKEDKLKPPPLGRRLLNFAKSVTLHTLRGNPTCTEEEILKRLEICKQCKLFKKYDDETGVCTHDDCGCNIQSQQKYLNKLAWRDQECPIGLWKRLD